MRFFFGIVFVGFWFFSCVQEELVVNDDDSKIALVNGVITYENAPFNGIVVSKYTDELLKSKVRYVEGRKEEVEKKWYPNGQLSQTRFYSKGVKIGIHQGWWEDGTQKFEYNFNEKGEYEGALREWYSNGQLVRDFNYSKGKEIGSQRMWTRTGKIRANYEVKNGERFGLIGLKKCYSVNTNSNELQ